MSDTEYNFKYKEIIALFRFLNFFTVKVNIRGLFERKRRQTWSLEKKRHDDIPQVKMFNPNLTKTSPRI